MSLELSPYTWRIVATATYSTANAASTAYSNITNTINSYSSVVSPRSGRYPAGISQPTSTQVVASYQTDTESDAKALAEALHGSLSTNNRSNVMVIVYRGNTE